MKDSMALRIGARRRMVRAACLALFCLLLAAAGQGGLFGLPADLFLRIDPLVGTAVPLAARAFIVTLLPAFVVILSAALAGRLFCGWICPMGTTLDAAGSLIRRKSAKHAHDPVPRSVKHAVLFAVLGAAFVGENIAFWASPIPLVTRLYALVLHPFGLVGADWTLALAEPALGRLFPAEAPYWFPELRGYRVAWFVGLFWLGAALLERVRPRFWCRYLCPAGALLGLVSRLAVRQRRVSPACTSCARCAVSCPAGLLHGNPSGAEASECFACRACEDVCTKEAVRFGFVKPALSAALPAERRARLSRRAFCGSLATGVALAGVSRLEAVGSLAGTGARGSPVRPPGSAPETEFLARCIRCGECMKACPTNGLQPAALQAGVSGMFSPFLDPRSGPCDPECAACGVVCPSGAIRKLPLREKRWAKIGTAVVDQKRCLAWAEDKRCMVCQETCPYGAVTIVPVEGHVAPVPVVRPERCYGCGFCERHCPTPRASVRVEPDGALRQRGPAFEEAARAAGLELEPGKRDVERTEREPREHGAPPGFLE